MELVDTSVWAQKSNPAIRGWFDAALIEGDLAICPMVVLEILQGARSAKLFFEIADGLEGVASLPMDAHEWQRAYEVYALIERQRGANVRRSVKFADLLIAACAERHNVTLVHYDPDYDVIALITGQSTRWAVERATLPTDQRHSRSVSD